MVSENLFIAEGVEGIEVPQINYSGVTMEPVVTKKIIHRRVVGDVVSKKEKMVDIGVIPETVQPVGVESLVSIIILAWNNLEYTKKCIDSIRKNTKVKYQLVVVDNGSSDRTCQYLETVLKDDDVLIRNARNIGFSSGNNLGARVARGEYLCFLNNDCEVSEGWINQLFDASKDLGLVGPSMGQVAPDFQKKEFKFVGFAREDNEWSYIEGWCLFLRREIFNFVGGFDTKFDPYLCEDADLSFKLKRHGMRIREVKNLKIKHHGSKTLQLEPRPEVQRVSEINGRRLFEKWLGNNVPDLELGVGDEKKGLSLVEQRKNINILVRRRGARGDVLLCTPILRGLRSLYPDSRIVFETDCPEMIQGNGIVDQLIRYRGNKPDGYDLYFDLSYERPGHKNYIDEMATCAGIEIDDRSLVFQVPENEIQWAKEYVGDGYKRKIGIHVGRSWKSREWSVDRFIEVGKYFLKNENCRFIELGDRETPYLGLGKDCRGFPIMKSAAIIKNVDAVLAIDSLVIHLAAAVGTPAVVIYGCTSPDVVWSAGLHYPVWIDDLPCKGCRHKAGGTFVDCVKGDYACLDRITPEMVIEKMNQCLRER
jgi:ADP-heptose:LPS heptosyltransferase